MRTRISQGLAAWLVLASAGCSKDHSTEATPAPVPLEVHVRADTGSSTRLVIRQPRARVWMANVTSAPPSGIAPSLPEAAPDTVFPEIATRAVEIDPQLKPPILKSPAEITFPSESNRRLRASRVTIELDVRVDETGAVTEVAWAGGDADSSIVNAARECARTMRFYPALLAGRPVAVWCRQRFQLGSGD